MPHLKIYTTTTCAFCKAEKEFLDEKGFKYETVNVDDDQRALEEMIKLSQMTAVPFNYVTDESGKELDKFVGFDKDRLIKSLGLAA